MSASCLIAAAGCKEEDPNGGERDKYQISSIHLESALITENAKDKIALTFSGAVLMTDLQGWSIETEPDTGLLLTGISGGGGTLSLSGEAEAGMSLTLHYSGDFVKDTEGRPIAPINFVVTNSIPLTWTVTYNPNGAALGNPPLPSKVSRGSSYSLPGRGTMNNGILGFAGWTLESAQGAHLGSAGSSFSPSADITLYAKWVDVSDIISDANDKLQAMNRVLGNPADNAPAAQTVVGEIAALNVLLAGTPVIIEMQTENGVENTIQMVYDSDAIYAKSLVIEQILNELNEVSEVIVDELLFRYIAPSDENPAPVQNATLRTAGIYEIELAGAAGGHTWTTHNKTAAGGKGGHIKGEYNFAANTAVDIRVGGAGTGTSYFDGTTYTKKTVGYTDENPGGYNGGGKGGAGNPSPYGAGASGGGATDVRLHSGFAVALTGLVGIDPRIAVAAGGGGAADIGWGNFAAGGNGGGEIGANGSAQYDKTGAGSESTPVGGTQTSGGTQPDNCGYTAGTPSQGADGVDGTNINAALHSEGRGGGGGGWWGGGAQTSVSAYMSSGAGGSSYAGGASGVTPVRTPVNETITDNIWGDGWARIKWIE